jgi:glutamyl-tRNA synthetase
VVLRRNDGVPAYNLAVVDDDDQGITEVVRGDDLLAVTPAQVTIQGLLGVPRPRYAHVPMVLAPDGTRLAKRHGAVTLDDLAARGDDATVVRTWLAVGLGLAEPGERVTAAQLVERFDLTRIPAAPLRLSAADLLDR